MSIQRYDIEEHQEEYPIASMVKNFDGDYVLYSDHAAEVAKLTMERDAALVARCTSPWPESPPCRGIQRERDKAAKLAKALRKIEEVAQNAADDPMGPWSAFAWIINHANDAIEGK